MGLASSFNLVVGEEFNYNGRAVAWIKNPITGDFDFQDMIQDITIGGTFTIDEYHSYEPSAYVWNECVDASLTCDRVPLTGEATIIFGIDVADILDYQGICTDCMKKHGPDPTDCMYNLVD